MGVQTPGTCPSTAAVLADVWEPKPQSGKVILLWVGGQEKHGAGGKTEWGGERQRMMRMMTLRTNVLLLYEN